MAREKYLLKIISGPHQGAEVALDEGELIIGSSQNCDLILSDTLVSPEHLKIVVNPNGVSIVALASPVYYDGTEIAKDENVPIEDFKFISVGTTHFLIGPVEGEWPALSAADIPNLTRLEKEAEANEEEQFEEKEIEVLEGEGGPPLTTEVEPEVIHTGFKKIWRDKKTLYIYGGSLLLLILITLGFLAWGMSRSAEIAEEINTQAEINKVVANTNHPQTFTVEELDNKFIVKGWVKNNEERHKVENQLRKIGNVTAEIRSQEQALENVRDFFSAIKAPVVISELEPGKIKISGYFGEDKGWEAAKADLARDVPGFKLVKDEVWTPSKLYPVIAEVLTKHNINEAIKFVPQMDGVILKGMISKAEIPEMKDAIIEFQSIVGKDIPIKNQIIVAKEEDLHLDLDMDSVIIGKDAFVITKSGQRLFEGGVLKGGYTIEKIDRDGVILSKGNQKITLKLGENYD